MSVHMQNDLELLKKKTLHLCASVEDDVQLALQAIEEKSIELAHQVISKDFDIDQMEVDVEEECLKILALHQPVAIDLRYIISVLKLNNDLERIGDLAVNIAERATYIAQYPAERFGFDLSDMLTKVRYMLKSSLDALVNMDQRLAVEVCKADDEVDDINRTVIQYIIDGIRNAPDKTEWYLQYLAVSRYLERIADHATNIAEDVLYMIKGTIVRHKTSEYKES